MSADILDAVNEYRAKIAALPLVYAFVLYHHERNTIVFATFFDTINREAEDKLAKIEAYMVDAFTEFAFDFHTTHLMGRNLDEFVPSGAIPLWPVPKSALQRASVAR